MGPMPRQNVTVRRNDKELAYVTPKTTAPSSHSANNPSQRRRDVGARANQDEAVAVVADDVERLAHWEEEEDNEG